MQISNKIYLFEEDTMKELCLMFFRLSAFFEIDPFIGRKFGIDEWIEAQLDENGDFNRYSDGTNYFNYWDGFNMPVLVVLDFANKFQGQITVREQRIIDQSNLLPADGYIIGWARNGFATTRDHEIAHALYFTDLDYKTQARNIVESLTPELRAKFVFGLEAQGYTVTDHEYVNDEIHAYLVGYDPFEYKHYYFPDIHKGEVSPYVEAMGTLYQSKI